MTEEEHRELRKTLPSPGLNDNRGAETVPEESIARTAGQEGANVGKPKDQSPEGRSCEAATWMPDYDYVREYATGREMEHCGAPSLSPWHRMLVEGTVAFAQETWVENYGAWLEAWSLEPQLPPWESLGSEQKSHAIAVSAHEHFHADMDLLYENGGFGDRLMCDMPERLLSMSK